MRILCLLITQLWTIGLAAGAEVAPGAAPTLPKEYGVPSISAESRSACSSDPGCVTLATRGDAARRMQTFEDALYYYEAAYGRTYDPSLLLAIARTLNDSRQPVSAARYYRLYLASDDTDPRCRIEAEHELATMERLASPGRGRQRRGARLATGGVLLSAGVGGLVLGVLSTINNRSGITLRSDVSCSNGDTILAKCFAPVPMEAAGWALGISLTTAGVMVLIDPLRLFGPRPQTRPPSLESGH